MPQHEKLDYVEMPSKNIAASKAFFTAVFGWDFTDYGPEYTAFSNQGLDGGFFAADFVAAPNSGGALVIFYSNNLEQTQAKVEAAGGHITTPIFTFPGGRRFHFTEPGGNELAVWGDPVA
jgi:uncharacterized protein